MEPQSPALYALITRAAALAAVALMVVGTFIVLRPFLAAGMFAAVFVLATWPLYVRLRRRLRNSDALAATVFTAMIGLLLVLPFAWLVGAAAERMPAWVEVVRTLLAEGVPSPPSWLQNIPWIGGILDSYWREIANDPGALRVLGRRLAEEGREPLLGAGRVIGEGILQLLLATFLAFFFYRDGERVVAGVRAGLMRLAGPLGEEIIDIVRTTVRSVVLGIVGTSIAQGAIATIGFLIAGVPAPFLLGGLTALLSIVPGGPVLVWLGATIWLLSEAQVGWAVFMLIWGAGLVSSIDNVLRPILISQGSDLSFALVFIGVLGGVLAFGFVGIFIGPTLIALAVSLWRRWAEHPAI